MFQTTNQNIIIFPFLLVIYTLLTTIFISLFSSHHQPEHSYIYIK